MLFSPGFLQIRARLREYRERRDNEKPAAVISLQIRYRPSRQSPCISVTASSFLSRPRPRPSALPSPVCSIFSLRPVRQPRRNRRVARQTRPSGGVRPPLRGREISHGLCRRRPSGGAHQSMTTNIAPAHSIAITRPGSTRSRLPRAPNYGTGGFICQVEQ